MATQVVAEESLGEYCANEPNFSEPHDKVPENEDASPKEPVETSTLNCVQTDNCMAFNGDITNNFIVQDNLKMNSEKEELKKSPICSISDVGLVLQPHLEHFNVENFSEEMCFIEDTSVDKLHRSLTDGLYGEDLCTGISHVSNELGQRWHTMEDRYKADVMEKAFRLNMVKDYTCLSHQNPIADFQLQLNATQQIDGWVQFGCKRDAIKRHSASAIADKSDIMRGTFLKDDSDASNTDNLFQNGWVNGQFLQHHGGESDFENFQNLSGRRLKRICDDVKDRNVDILLHNINLAIREIVLNMQKQIDNLKENYEQVVHDKMCLAKIITYQQDECSKVEDENLENGADILASNDEEFDSVKICINDSCVLKEQCAKLWQIHSELQLENNKLKSLECSLKEQMPEQYQKFAQCEKNFQMNFVEIQNELKQVLREKLELEKKASSQAEEVTLLRNQLLEIRQKYGDSKLDKECGITIGTTQNCATELENSFGECLKEESKCDVSGNFSLSNFEEMYLEGVQNESYLNRFSNRVLQMHFFKDRLGNLQEDKDLFVLQLEEQEHLMTRMQGQSEVTGLMESQAQLSFEFQVTAPQLPRANLHAPEENFKAKQSSIIAVLEQRTAMGKPFQNDLDTVKERRAELMSQKQQNQEMHDALSCETQNFEKGDANKELGYQLEKENKRMEQTEENLRVNGDALHTGLAKKAIQPEVHRSHAEEQVLKIELLENQLTVEHLKVQELQCLLDERHSLLQKQSHERSHTVSGLTEHECCIEEKHEDEMQALKAKYELQLAEAKEELEKRLMELREQLDSQRITQIALIKEVHEREREREVAAIIEQHIMEMQQLRVTLFRNQRRLERGINCGCDEQQEVEAMAREQETEMQPQEDLMKMVEVIAESDNFQVDKDSLENRLVEKISTLSKELEESKWVNSTLKERFIRCSEDLQETQRRLTDERKATHELIVNHQKQKEVHSREMKDFLNLLNGRQQEQHSVQIKDVDFIHALQKCQNDMDLMKNELTVRHQEEMELLKYLLTQIHQEEIESMKKTLDVIPQERQHESNLAKLKMLLNMDCYETMEMSGTTLARQSFADIQSLRNDHRIAIEECIMSHEENLKEMQAIIFSRDKELRAIYDEKAAVFKHALMTKIQQEIIKLKESCGANMNMLRKILEDGQRERAEECARLVDLIKMLLCKIQEDHKAELEDKKQNLEREHQLKRETLLQEIREQQMQQDGALQELQLLYKQQMQQLFQEQEAQHQAKIEALSSQHKHEVQVMALASERELEKLAQELKIRLGVTESWPAKERVEDDRHSSLQTEYGEVQRVTQHSHKEVLLEELSRLQVLQKEEKENLNKAVQAKANQAEQFQAEASRLRELVQQVQLELETVLHRRERENGEGDTLFTMLRADLQNKEIDRQEILGANQHILQVLSEVFQQTLSSEELIGQRVVSLLADGRPVHTVMAEHLGQTASEVTSAIAGSEVLDNFDTPHEKLEISQHLAESLFVGPVLEPREEKLVLESTQRLHGALQHLLSLLIELTQQVQEARSAHAELLQESTRCTMELSKAMCEHKQLLVKLEEESQAHQRLKFELYETKGLLEGFRLEKSLKSWVPWWEPLAQLVENTDEGYLHPEVPQVQNCTAGISEQQESDLQASVCVVEKLESGPAQNAAEEKKRGPKARAEKDVYERSSQVTTLEASLEGQQKRSGKLAEENETASGGLQKQVHFLESQSKKSKNLHQCAKFRIDEQETERANLQQVVCRLEGPPQCAKGLTSLLNAVSETQLTELEEQLKNGAERWRELVQGKLLAEEALHALQGEFSQFQQEYTKSRQVQQQLQQDLDRQHRAIEDLQQDKESLQEQQCENLLQITGLQARLDKQKQQLLPQGQNQGEQDDQLDQLLRQTRAEIELQSRQLESLRNELQQKEIEKLSLAEEGDVMNMRLKEMKEENLKLQDEIDSLRTQSSQTSSNVSSDILGLPIALLEEKNQEIDLLNEQISVLQEEMKIIRKSGLSDDKTTPSMEWMKSGTSATSLPGLQQSVSTMTLSVNLPHSVPNAVPSVEWPRSVTSAAPSVERLRSVTSAAPSVERLRTMTSVAHSVERPWSVDSAVLSVEQPQSMTSAAPSVERPRSVTSAAPSVEQLRTVTSVVPSVERPRSVTSATPSVERPRSVTSEVLSVGRPRSVTHAAPSVGRPRSVASTIPSVERMRSVASSTSSLVDHSYSPVPLSEKSNSCASDISRCLHMEMETAEQLDAKLAEHVHRWLHQQVPASRTQNDIFVQSTENFADFTFSVQMQEAIQRVQKEGYHLLALSQQPLQTATDLKPMETEKMDAYLQHSTLPEAKDEGSESRFHEQKVSEVKGSQWNAGFQEKSVLLQNIHSVQRPLATPVHPAVATADVSTLHDINMTDRHSLLEELEALRSQCQLTELRLQEESRLLDEEKSHREHSRHVHEQQLKRQTELNEHKLQQVKDEMQALCRALDDERERSRHTAAQLDEEHGNLSGLQTQLYEERRNVAKFRTQLDKMRGVASDFQTRLEEECRRTTVLRTQLETEQGNAFGLKTKSDEDRQYLVHLQTQLDEERQHTASVCTQLNEARCELDRIRMLPPQSSVEHKWRDELQTRSNEIKKLWDAFRSKEAQTAEMQREFESKKQEMQRDLENQQKSLQQEQANVEKLRAALQHVQELHQQPIPTKVQEEYTQVQQKLLNEKARAIQLESLLQKERDRVTEHQNLLQKEKDCVSEHQNLLQKEKDRVSEHQNLLQKEKDNVYEHKDLLQKEKNCVSEYQNLLQKEKDRVSEHQNLLQKEKDRVSEHHHLLQKEKDRVYEYQDLLQKEKDHVYEYQDLLQKERDSGVRRLHLLQKERDTIEKLQNLLQKERDQVSELQDRFQEEKKQVADLQYELFGEQVKVSELKFLLPNESVHCVEPKSQLNMHHLSSCIQHTAMQTDKSNVKDVGTSPCQSPFISKHVDEELHMLPQVWRMRWRELEVELQGKCKQVQELKKQMEALRIAEPRQDENVPEHQSCHVEEKQSSVEKQLYKYHSRYLRAESFRKSLAYQKVYLLLLIGGFEATEKATLALVARMGAYPKAGVAQPGKINRFRSTAWVIIAIIRLQFLVKKWRAVYRTKRMILRHVSRSEKLKVNSPLEFPVACNNSPCYLLTRPEAKAASSIR